MKKFLSIVLVAMLLVAMFAVPASAEAVKLTPVSYEIISGDGQPASDVRAGNLIDGQLGNADYDSGLWYAFKDNNVDNDGSKIGTVVLDLGEVTEVNTVRVHHFGQTPDGVGTPWGIIFYYSEDGENWTSGINYADTGSVQANSTVTCVETGTVYEEGSNPPVWTAGYDTYWTALNDTHNARYVKVEIKFLGGAPWGFVSEIEVYGVATSGGSDDTTDEGNTEGSTEDTTEENTETPDDNTQGETSTKPSTPSTGDASSMVIFAVIALVSVAGAAIVVKNRR